MNKLCIIACIGMVACQAYGWSAEDIMPMHPGAAYTAPDRSNRARAARSTRAARQEDGWTQLQVNQVRLRQPSSGPGEPRMHVVEVKSTRPDGSIDFSQARLPQLDDMGIPGLVIPEMLATDYAYQHQPYSELEPAGAYQSLDAWSDSFALPPAAMPVIEPLELLSFGPTAGAAFAHEPLVVEMPPPISAPHLPIPSDAGRLYEETPIFYSSVPPVQMWTGRGQ